jgi:hypothetical protein
VPTHEGYILRILGEAKEPLFARQIERLNSEPPVQCCGTLPWLQTEPWKVADDPLALECALLPLRV